MMTSSEDREIFALLRRLSIRGTSIRLTEEGDYRLANAKGTGPRVAAATVTSLLSRGLLTGSDKAFSISSAGKSAMRRHIAAGAPEDFGAQHRQIVNASIETETGRESVTVNAAESPLAWLRRRKGPSGRPFLDVAQFQAGERLRADFTRAHLMPRITANWDAAVSSGKRAGDGGIAELTDAVISARRRVEKAIEAVGPDFGELLLDFCCFLKGIEDIERTRRWPARSAKLVLQMALTSLARHYGLATKTTASSGKSRLLHWGAEDYRPTIR